MCGKSGVSGGRRWGRCDWSHGDGEEPMREERVCSTPGKRGGTWPLCREQNTTIFSSSMCKSLFCHITTTRAPFLFAHNNHYSLPLYLFLQLTHSFPISNKIPDQKQQIHILNLRHIFFYNIFFYA